MTDQAALIAQRNAKPVHEGGTGATDAVSARANLGAAAAPLNAVAAWTPGTVANLAGVTTTVALPTATPANNPVAAFNPALPPGVILSAGVTGIGIVTVTLLNLSGSPQVIGAGTLRIDAL